MADDKFDKLLQKADEAIRRNNHDYAISILDQILKMNPDHEEGNGKYFEAVRKKTAAAGKSPKPNKMNLIKLMGLQKMKQWDKLMEAARTTFVKDPMHTEVLLKLADALMNLKHYNAAVITLRRATELDASNATAWFWLALSFSNAEQNQESVKAAERARQLDPQNKEIADFYRNISARNVIQTSGLETAKGVQDLVKDEKAMREEVQSRKMLTDDDVRAKIAELGGWENNTEQKVLREIAELHGKIGDYQNAVKSWKKIYQLNPQNVEALDRAGDLTVKYYDKLVRAAQTAGETDKARAYSKKRLEFELEEYKRRVEAHPTDLALRYQYGEALFKAKRYMEAAGELQKSIRDPKIKAKGIEVLAQCFIEIDQFDLAIMQIDDVLESAEGQGEEKQKNLIYFKAFALEKAGRSAEAKPLYMSLLAEDISFKDVAARVKALS